LSAVEKKDPEEFSTVLLDYDNISKLVKKSFLSLSHSNSLFFLFCILGCMENEIIVENQENNYAS
jgi:hypothetical protein